ncbi:MAG: 4-hydroxy-tetrahydrodipicolinate reductase [Bacteroidales bacterium]
MKIALIGYGKMGKAIEQIALERGHEVILKIDLDNQNDNTPENLKKADVVIEFTIPKTAPDNYKKCFDAGVPVVSGTTGWLEQWDEIIAYCKSKNGTFFYASNFSIGVNLFFKINKELAQLMKTHSEYLPSIEETHHIHKLDAPSGTGITIAEGVCEAYGKKWALSEDITNDNNDTIPIVSKREGEVPGDHSVTYDSDIDFIKIEHSAKSRKGFAFGAVLAAEYANENKGILNMNKMLNI